MKNLFYIHQASCISPQQTFPQADLNTLAEPAAKMMKAREPNYTGIPPGMLRRMGTAVRMGVGAAMPVISRTPAVNGIILGTANGGMEDCIRFLNQIIQYGEGTLTPGNFVQSTPNAIAAQIGLLSRNQSYNNTHVHRGLSFENAMTDAAMQLSENNHHEYLLGAVDEISSYNYNIEFLGDWYKEENCNAGDLYKSGTPGCIAGEGAAMFRVSKNPGQALAQVRALATVHSEDKGLVGERLQQFLINCLSETGKMDLLLSGENGDNRLNGYYHLYESVAGKDIPVARFKHMSGEYPTASAQALWLAVQFIKQLPVPMHMLKNDLPLKTLENILVCNNYKGYQHSFIWISK